MADSVWEKNACVRVTGRACISPTVRADIRYDHIAMANRQPEISATTTEAYSALQMALCSCACTRGSSVWYRPVCTSCRGRMTTHTSTYMNSSGQ